MNQSVHKKIFVVGKLSPGMVNSLTTNWLVSLAHQYETVRALHEYGEMTLRRAEFNTVLIGDGVSADDRRYILQTVEERGIPIMIGVLTTEPSYESWSPIPPEASASQIASTMGFVVRVDPAQIIIMASTKGGVGKSTIATNMAIAMSQLPKGDGTNYRVALIDDDRTTRSIRALMGIDETAPTTAELVSEVTDARGVVTLEIVDRYLLNAHGVKTLVGPPTLITDFPLEIDTARETLSIMAQEMGLDFIIIDAPPDFINTSSFTYTILRDMDPSMKPAMIFVPIVPEQILLRSVDDTLATLTHFQHPIEFIFPIINSMRPTHDPETVRGDKVLWRDPLGIIPYVQTNQFVGETGIPITAEDPETFLQRFIRGVILGQATIKDAQDAYADMGRAALKFMEETHGARVRY
ncbi:MAG: ParA family protein [Chloroflexota bacterium]